MTPPPQSFRRLGQEDPQPDPDPSAGPLEDEARARAAYDVVEFNARLRRTFEAVFGFPMYSATGAILEAAREILDAVLDPPVDPSGLPEILVQQKAQEIMEAAAYGYPWFQPDPRPPGGQGQALATRKVATSRPSVRAKAGDRPPTSIRDAVLALVDPKTHAPCWLWKGAGGDPAGGQTPNYHHDGTRYPARALVGWFTRQVWFEESPLRWSCRHQWCVHPDHRIPPEDQGGTRP